MNLYKFFLIINLIWFLSEILIGRLTFHKSPEKERDQKSLTVIWLTIVFSLIAGIFISIKGIGRFPFPAKLSLTIGTLLISFGLIIRGLAIFTLRHFFTSNVQILKDHQIISSGIYGIIRHPAYSGSLLSFLGLGLAFNSWLGMLVIFVPVLLAFSFRIKIEEQALEKAFGNAYQAYKQQTKKLIPFIY